MKNRVYLIVVILVIFLFLLAIYSYLVGEGIIEGFFSPYEKDFFSGDESSDKTSSSSSGGGSGSNSGSGVGGYNGDEEAGSPNQKQQRQLPADLYTNECGYYFAEYDVCAGVCPDGSSCGSDGRSCYCRKN